MARKINRQIPVSQSGGTVTNGNGDPVLVHDMTGLTIQVKGTFSANVRIQGAVRDLDPRVSESDSYVAADWVDLPGISTPSPTVFFVPHTLAAMRAVTSDSASGLPEINVIGLDRVDF